MKKHYHNHNNFMRQLKKKIENSNNTNNDLVACYNEFLRLETIINSGIESLKRNVIKKDARYEIFILIAQGKLVVSPEENLEGHKLYNSKDIIEETGIKRSTVYETINFLENMRLIDKRETNNYGLNAYALTPLGREIYNKL